MIFMKCESWIYFAHTVLFFYPKLLVMQTLRTVKYRMTFKNQNFPKPPFIVIFFSLWLNLFWVNIIFKVNLSLSVLLMQLFNAGCLMQPSSAKEDVTKFSLPLLPDQGCFNGNMVLLIWFTWEFLCRIFCLYLSRKPNNLLALTGKKRDCHPANIITLVS